MGEGFPTREGVCAESSGTREEKEEEEREKEREREGE